MKVSFMLYSFQISFHLVYTTPCEISTIITHFADEETKRSNITWARSIANKRAETRPVFPQSLFQDAACCLPAGDRAVWQWGGGAYLRAGAPCGAPIL